MSGVNVIRQLCRTLERTSNIYLNDYGVTLCLSFKCVYMRTRNAWSAFTVLRRRYF